MSEVLEQIKRVRLATKAAASLAMEVRNSVLLDLAAAIRQNMAAIIAANALDLAKMAVTDPKYDRLQLNEVRLNSLSEDIIKVSQLPSPLQRVIEQRTLPNGILLQKISVPLGVVAVIFEARPNVTIDVFCLCFKSGNGALLKGGSEAAASNQILLEIIRATLKKHHLAEDLVALLPPERKHVYELLNAVGLIDVCIPRGSQALIEFVRANARIPVIETGAGIVHAYFDRSGDLTKGRLIVENAKTRRVSVCNALDSLLIHQQRLNELALLVEPLAAQNVILFADPLSQRELRSKYPAHLLQTATPDSFGQEFLDYKLAIKCVASAAEAIAHIQKFSSGHSEAIIAEDPLVVSQFMSEVDAAVVYANASTSFSDAGEFGMGAEIGISTQKLHARGPMGLAELTSYKWLAFGCGQIR